MKTNKLALFALAAGGLLASATISAAVAVTGNQQDHPSTNSRVAQHQHGSGDGHAHDAKGHNDHKDHPGHKEGDTHKDHPEHKDGDKHEDHRGHGGHAEDEKRSDTHGNTQEASETSRPAGNHGHGHDEGKGGHDDHGGAIKLSAEQIREFDIKIDQAQGGDIPVTIVRPAEIKFNQDRVAHVVPRVSGVVRSVAAREGEVVEAGTVMAILDSRELADAKSAYLGAAERVHLADITHERERKDSSKEKSTPKNDTSTPSPHWRNVKST